MWSHEMHSLSVELEPSSSQAFDTHANLPRPARLSLSYLAHKVYYDSKQRDRYEKLGFNEPLSRAYRMFSP